MALPVRTGALTMLVGNLLPLSKTFFITSTMVSRQFGIEYFDFLRHGSVSSSFTLVKTQLDAVTRVRNKRIINLNLHVLQHRSLEVIVITTKLNVIIMLMRSNLSIRS